jgi:hypothetical protein
MRAFTVHVDLKFPSMRLTRRCSAVAVQCGSAAVGAANLAAVMAHIHAPSKGVLSTCLLSDALASL